MTTSPSDSLRLRRVRSSDSPPCVEKAPSVSFSPDNNVKSPESSATKKVASLAFWRVSSAVVVVGIVLVLSLSYATTDTSEPRSRRTTSTSLETSKSEQVTSLDNSKATTDNVCWIYLAPTSLPGNQGFGLYTVRDFKKNEKLLRGPDGPDIPVFDSLGFGHEKKELVIFREKWNALFDEYWWGRGVADQVFFEADEVNDFQIMFGSLPNHHCILQGLEITWPEPAYDEQGLNRFKDPGAGAFSYHRGRDFRAIRDLKAGEEIFLDYGYCDHSSDTKDWTSRISKFDDYERALAILRRARWKFAKTAGQPIDEMPEEVVNQMLTAIREGAAEAPEQTVSLLPKTREDLSKVLAKKSADNPYTDTRMRLAKYMGTTKRSVDWVIENGRCLDNIVPGRSTLRQAGQGAFAQRPLSTDEVIVPAPLLQIIHRDVLAVYDEHGEHHGTQLLMNYCFGHKESSLLLCPNTNAILINHCSLRKRECGDKGPNAEYRWATDWDPDTEKWLQKTVGEIAQEAGRGLAFEIVATRNIEPGEEIFIDYGAGWEEAWEKHVADWKPPAPGSGFDTYVSAKELNEAKSNGSPLDVLVTGDLREVILHNNLFAGCMYRGDHDDEEEDPTWKDLSDEEILRRYERDGSVYTGNYETHKDRSYWPCSIIRADDENRSTYTVRIDPWRFTDDPIFLTSYPAESIRIFNEYYKSDQHLPGAFRHPIEIRDEIFPDQWKNLRK